MLINQLITQNNKVINAPTIVLCDNTNDWHGILYWILVDKTVCGNLSLYFGHTGRSSIDDDDDEYT